MRYVEKSHSTQSFCWPSVRCAGWSRTSVPQTLIGSLLEGRQLLHQLSEELLLAVYMMLPPKRSMPRPLRALLRPCRSLPRVTRGRVWAPGTSRPGGGAARHPAVRGSSQRANCSSRCRNSREPSTAALIDRALSSGSSRSA